MKHLKKLVFSVFIMGIFTVLFSLTAFAERQVIEWDGKSEISAGNTYIVTDTVKLKSEITIPEGAKLSIKDGGELKIYKKGNLTVRGELLISDEGKIFNSGTISVKKGAEFNIYGLLQSSVSGNINVSGEMTIYRQGIAEISSALKLYKDALIYNRGELHLYKSSNSTISGEIRGDKKSQLHLQGIMNITVNGSINMSGHLTIGSRSKIRCSGLIHLDENSSYTRFKKITVTKNGRFIDERPEDVYADMTVNILVDEPKITRKGIDVSYAQGDIDWKKVADSGVEFAIIRAGRGRAGSKNQMKEDDYFRQNIKGAQENGIDVGVYFYSYATSVSEAREEARFLLEIIDGYQIQYPVILDMEEEFQSGIGTKKLTNMIEAFFEVLMEEKYFPMFYSYKSWIEENLDMTILDKYAVWLAQVGDKVTYDGGYYIWQYSFKGKVSGISTDVDLDYSYRDFPAIFRKYGLNNM